MRWRAKRHDINAGPPVLKTLIVLSLLAVAGVLLAAVATSLLAARIEARHPPVGRFIEVAGARLHVVDEGPRDAPAVLLIHGASGNLRDQIAPARATLGATHRLIAVDRPGHGWSGRGADGATIDGQARMLGALLDALGVDQAVAVGHSFGAAVAASLALARPERVRGVVFVSPASHPWPGGATSWYNDMAMLPVLGPLFTRTIALPAGLTRLKAATDCVFAPNRQPETYLDDAAIALVLTPARFRANAEDVTGLHAHVTRRSRDYPSIAKSVIIITGDHDTVVSVRIHSGGLLRDIPGARRILVRNLGHKPDHAAPELVAGAIRAVEGATVDLDALARDAEARLAGDRFGPVEACPPYDAPETAAG